MVVVAKSVIVVGVGKAVGVGSVVRVTEGRGVVVGFMGRVQTSTGRRTSKT